jgi:hypothetical protein
MGGLTAMAKADSQDHHGSHRHLLWTPGEPSSHRARVDAVIVPTIRHPAYLQDAADLAVSLGCPLVTLHSGKWTSARDAAQRLPAAVDLIAIDVSDPARLHLPVLETSRLLASARLARKTDTSAKRNLGLVLSHLVGWERIVFLDDDIKVREPGDLRRAAGLLDTYSAVGLSIVGFPDNSVVCHAYRAVGGTQQSFIGGGALVVGLARSRSFFPDIYNEDWFYLLDAEKGLQAIGTSGQAAQRPYDPFHDPERARREELGDVLAEGTFWLLDQGRTVADADWGHWAEFLERRRKFTAYVLDRVVDSGIETAEKGRMIAALKASRGRLALITPGLCRDYLRAWTADWQRWQRHFDRLHGPVPLDSALRLLTRQDAPPVTWHARGRRAAGEVPPAGPVTGLATASASPAVVGR